MKENNYLEELHIVELEILKEIDRICKENNITYILCGGSLLGAVRHKGFIPWDDDVDIAMPRKDYNKFIDVCCNNGINKKYFLHCNETDSEYWLPFAKVRKNKTTMNEKSIAHLQTHKGIYVDIFPLDNIGNKLIYFKKIKFSIIKILIGDVLYKKNIYKSINECQYPFLAKILLIIPLSLNKKIQKKLMTSNKNNNSTHLISYTGMYGFNKEYIPRDKYFPTSIVTFEKNKYPGAADFDYYLTSLYKDYMKLPPKEDRITHNPLNVSFDEGETRITKKI